MSILRWCIWCSHWANLLNSSHSRMQQAGDQMAQLTGVSQTFAGTMEQLSTIFYKLLILIQFKLNQQALY